MPFSEVSLVLAMCCEEEFRGKTVLVTGAGRNIGRACALEFGALGANVVVNVRTNRAEAEAVAAEIESLGGHALVCLADVGMPDEVERMVEEVRQRFGAISIYISNAAVRPRQDLLSISYDDWHRVLNTNLHAAFYLAKAIVPDMIRQRWGRIIHISGHDAWVGLEHRAHNVTAKAGLHGLTKAMAKELGRYGITVNTVVPGAFNTTRPREHYPFWSAEERARANPLGRIGDPREIAWVCRFLASERSGYITGQAIHVNGGEHMF